MGIRTLGRVGKPVHTHYGHRGLLHVLMGTVHTYMGKHVSTSTVLVFAGKGKYSIYWAYRLMHSCPGHFTVHMGISRARGHSAHPGPLVLGPPKGPKLNLYLFRSIREPLLMGNLQSLCPPATIIPCFPCMPCNTACS